MLYRASECFPAYATNYSGSRSTSSEIHPKSGYIATRAELVRATIGQGRRTRLRFIYIYIFGPIEVESCERHKMRREMKKWEMRRDLSSSPPEAGRAVFTCNAIFTTGIRNRCVSVARKREGIRHRSIIYTRLATPFAARQHNERLC